MSADIQIIFILMAVVIFLFSTEWLPIEIVCFGLLLSLYFLGLVDLEHVFSGFGNEVVFFLGSLFVVTEGLKRTGALLAVEDLLWRLIGRNPKMFFITVVTGTGFISAFMSNTATVAAVLPSVIGLSQRIRVPSSHILMPLAFGSILGGTCTLVGTSTNIIISGFLPRYGLDRLSLFELFPVGFPVLILGVLYLYYVGQRILKVIAREPIDPIKATRPYLAEIIIKDKPIKDKSIFAGQPVDQVLALIDPEIDLLGLLEPDGGLREAPLSYIVKSGDILLIKAPPQVLAKLQQRTDIELTPHAEPSPKATEPLQIHELLLTPHSRLTGRSIKEQQLKSRHNISVLAIFRRGHMQWTRLSDILLHAGDVLLVQGELSGLKWLLKDGDLILLDQTELPLKGMCSWLSVTVFGLMMVAGGSGWMPFSIAALAAGCIMLTTGCLDLSNAYNAIEWRLLILVGSLLVMARAMEDTGATQYMAQLIIRTFQGTNPLILLTCFFILTMLLTQPMSNQAAALVVLPLAIQTALEQGLNPRAFAVVVAISASCSFITPLEPASRLVYGAGRYRFRDFFIVGLPLSLLVMAVTLILVPIFWPL